MQDKVPTDTEELSTAKSAELLVRRALKATLATVHHETGHPYASLVTIATDPAGSPVTLISGLAVHTKNVLKNPKASVLCEAPSGSGEDPLTAGRVTVMGEMVKVEDAILRKRFLARHPYAEVYVDFADFSFWRLNIETAHFIGGFGRISGLTSTDLLTDLTGADELLAAEDEIVTHMNEDHSDAVQLYAAARGAVAGDWRMTGIDPSGFDIVCGEAAERIPFETRVASADEARGELVRLANQARKATQNA